MVHKEGYTSIAICVLCIMLSNALVRYYFPDYTWLKWCFYVLSILFLVGILQFFRNPKVLTKHDPQLVICPADGSVVAIEEVEEEEYFKERRVQVSIFMSPINVHVNRCPVSGVVRYFHYHPGKYLVAWNPKSSLDNERTTIVVETENGVSILFRQIAGALARRIVWYVKEGDKVHQGEQFGFIKFGSRVDIFLPLDAKVKVFLNQKVRGGITTLAELEA